MNTSSKNLAYVDLLRGIAVLMVVLVHTAQGVQGLSTGVDSIAKYGQMGIQLFFVVSAYTLCLSFHRRQDEPLRTMSFYIRRIFRIAPLYYTGILVYFGLYIYEMYHLTGEIASVGPYTPFNVFANVFFLHGLVPQANNNIVPGGWSIGTEMLFYAIFPVLYGWSVRIVDKFGLAGFFCFFLFVFSCNLGAQLFLQNTRLAIQNGNFSYFNIINQLLVFLIGMWMFFLEQQTQSLNGLFSRMVSILGFLLFFVITLILWQLNIDFLFSTIPTMAAISFACLLNFLKLASPGLGFLKRIGELSYSIYIFHFLFAWHIVPAGIPLFFKTQAGDSVLVFSFLLVTTLTVCVSLFTQKTIEAQGMFTGANIIRNFQNTANSSSH